MNKEQIIEKVKEAALNKVVQIIGGILVSIVLGFASGRSSVSVPEKDVSCFDYKEDIRTLSGQLDEARAECIVEKRRLANKVRNEMERWMNAIANHADAGGVQNPELYFADLKVEQFDRDETVVKTYTFKDAWPSSISPIELSYADDNIERFTIEWQYQYWTSNTTDA